MNTAIDKFPISAFTSLPPSALKRADGTPYDFITLYKIQKVEEQNDGTLHVYGIVTAELPDSANEICDYAKTKPLYQSRCAEMIKTTSIPGMEQSIMPLREMHGLNAVGKGTQIDYDDADKTIRMGFEVVDPLAVTKVKKGVLPCFSQGGNYAEKWADPKNKKLTRYAADPGEVSLVDRGCLPGAVIEAIKNQSFEFVKADGSMQLRKFATDPPASASDAVSTTSLSKADLQEFAQTFAETLDAKIEQRLHKDAKTKRKGGKDLSASDFAYVGDKDDTATWKLPIHDAPHVRNALARFNQTDGIPADERPKVKRKIDAAASKFGIKAADEAEKLMHAVQYLQAATGETEMEKGLYQVSQMAEILETIAWLQASAVYERDFEGDESVQPEDLKALLEDAIACFTSMVEEEAGELAEHAAAMVAKGAESMTPEQLKKAAEHMTALKGHLAAMSGHMGKAMECCDKALDVGGSSLNVAGSGPSNTDIRVAGNGSGAHEAKAMDYVSIGKTADGTEIFKAVPHVEATPGSFNQDEFLAKLDELIEKRIDENTTAMLKALFASVDGGGMVATTETAAGVGDRTMVIGKAAQTQVVTKAADATSGAGAGGTQVADKPTTEIYKKGLTGDMDARLKFAKTIRRMGPGDVARVQSNLSSFARH